MFNGDRGAVPDIEVSEAPRGGLRLRLGWAGEPAWLSDVMPVLESLGLRVADHRRELAPAGQLTGASVDDFGVFCDRTELPLLTLAPLVHDVFGALWDGRAEADGLNGLVLTGGLTWNLRPTAARIIVTAFTRRLDPSGDSGADGGGAEHFTQLLGQVKGLDEDRLLRGLWQFVQATVRTNYFQLGPDGNPSRTWHSSLTRSACLCCRGHVR